MYLDSDGPTLEETFMGPPDFIPLSAAGKVQPLVEYPFGQTAFNSLSAAGMVQPLVTEASSAVPESRRTATRPSQPGPESRSAATRPSQPGPETCSAEADAGAGNASQAVVRNLEREYTCAYIKAEEFTTEDLSITATVGFTAEEVADADVVPAAKKGRKKKNKKHKSPVIAGGNGACEWSQPIETDPGESQDDRTDDIAVVDSGGAELDAVLLRQRNNISSKAIALLHTLPACIQQWIVDTPAITLDDSSAFWRQLEATTSTASDPRIGASGWFLAGIYSLPGMAQREEVVTPA